MTSPNTLQSPDQPEVLPPSSASEQMTDFVDSVRSGYVPTVFELGDQLRSRDTLTQDPDTKQFTDEAGKAIDEQAHALHITVTDARTWALSAEKYNDLSARLGQKNFADLSRADKREAKKYEKPGEAIGDKELMRRYRGDARDRMALSEKLYEMDGKRQPTQTSRDKYIDAKNRLLRESLDEGSRAMGMKGPEKFEALNKARQKFFDGWGPEAVAFAHRTDRFDVKKPKAYQLSPDDYAKLGFAKYSEFETDMLKRQIVLQRQVQEGNAPESLKDKVDRENTVTINHENVAQKLRELDATSSEHDDVSDDKGIKSRLKRLFKREKAEQGSDKRGSAARVGGAIALAAALILTSQEQTVTPSRHTDETHLEAAPFDNISYHNTDDKQRILDEIQSAHKS